MAALSTLNATFCDVNHDCGFGRGSSTEANLKRAVRARRIALLRDIETGRCLPPGVDARLRLAGVGVSDCIEIVRGEIIALDREIRALEQRA